MTDSGIGPISLADIMALPDGVYVDSVNGVAGTAWPIGTPGRPVSNLADALTIMAARNLPKLYLGNDLTFDTNVSLTLVGNPKYDIAVSSGITVNFYGDVSCNTLTNTGGKVYVFGNLYVAEHDLTSSGALKGVYVYGDCYVNGYVSTTAGSEIGVFGNMWAGSSITVSGTNSLLIVEKSLWCHWDCTISSGGLVEIQQDCLVGLTLTATGTSIVVKGILTVKNLASVGGYIEAAGGIRVVGDFSSDGDPYICTAGVFYWGADALPHSDTFINGGFLEAPECHIYHELDCNSSVDSATSRIVNRGSLTVNNMVAGATAIIDLCGGTLTIAATCTGGTITLYGDCKLVDLSGAAVTVVDERVPGHA